MQQKYGVTLWLFKVLYLGVVLNFEKVNIPGAFLKRMKIDASKSPMTIWSYNYPEYSGFVSQIINSGKTNLNLLSVMCKKQISVHIDSLVWWCKT